MDVASILGHKSPFRFNKIENFPLYGMEQIVLQLQETDVGLDSSYEGEATTLPSTIRPVQNDYFIIPILHDYYVFRITDIQYDNLMPDNYYRINFRLEFLDESQITNLNNQTVEDYVCVLENIGTEQECIIQKESFGLLKNIQKMYHDIIEFYNAMFYDERHNSYLCELESGRKIYDPFQTDFINLHGLFKEKNNLLTTILTEQYNDPKRKYKYSKSVYKYIELRDYKLLSTFKYTLRPGTSIHESSFYRWHDKMIDVIDIPNYFPDNCGQVFSSDYVDAITYNAEVYGDYATLIQRFVRKEELHLKDIPLTLDNELLYLNNSLEVFFFTPIIMYVIREIIKTDLQR